MPLGERIGQAYVKVILDGDAKDFGEQLRAAGETAGRDSAFGTAEAWDKEFKRSMRNRIRKNAKGMAGALAKDVEIEVAKQFRRSKLIEEELGSQWFKNFEKGVRDRVKNSDIADVMMREIQRKFVQSGGNRKLIGSLLGDSESSMGRFRQLLDSASAEVERARHAEAAKAEVDQRNLEKGLRSLAKEAERFAIFIERSGKGFATTRAEVVHLRSETDRLKAGLERAFAEGPDVLGERDFNRIHADLTRFQRDLDNTDVDMNRFRITSNRVSDGLGRAFGRGSRNDFINFMGAVVRGFSLATARIVEFGGRVFNVFRKGAAEGEGFFGSLLSGSRAVAARAAPILTKAFTGFLVIGPIIVNLFGSLISAAISLGGALVAVGSALVGGLVGGLTILAGLILPVVAGIGGLVGAILLMDDATKAATKQAIQPFIAQMKELAKITAGEAFANLETNAKRLSKAFESPAFTNFAREIGKGLDEVQAKLVAAVESPKFAAFFERMGPQFRKQLVALTDIAINFGAGFAGVFVAIQPAIDRFLGRLQRVGAEFNTWANSIGGQRTLRDFFLRAEQSLASISGLAVQVGRAFAVMFNLGGGAAGVQIINDITQKVKEFIAFMRKNPEIVGEFFAGAVQIARDFGNIILSIVGLFRTLNSESRRNIAHLILQGIAGAIRLISAAIKLLDWTPLGFFIDALFAFQDAMRRTSAFTAQMIGVIVSAFQGLNQLPHILGGGHFDPIIKSLKDAQASIKILNSTPIDPAVNLDGVFDLTAAMGTATETIQFTDEEMQELHKQFGIPLVPKVELTPLESVRTKIQQVIESAANMNRIFSVLPGGGIFGAVKMAADIGRAMQTLTAGGGVQVAVKPTVDAAALGSISGAITTAVGSAPAKVKATMDPASLTGIKTSLDGLTAKDIQITAGGNAQAVIGRTKTALDGLKPKDIQISAGGNAQGVIGRTKTALGGLKNKAISISAGGNAQGVIARTQTALAGLKPKKIDISAGGNAQAVIARTASALAALKNKTITITIRTVRKGGARGGMDFFAAGGFPATVEKFADGGFANFRQQFGDFSIIGESGREAIVPLSRPLSQVDPSVRMLSAIAQGKVALGRGVGVDASGWTIISNSKDPVTVARETLAQLTASSY